MTDGLFLDSNFGTVTVIELLLQIEVLHHFDPTMQKRQTCIQQEPNKIALE